MLTPEEPLVRDARYWTSKGLLRRHVRACWAASMRSCWALTLRKIQAGVQGSGDSYEVGQTRQQVTHAHIHALSLSEGSIQAAFMLHSFCILHSGSAKALLRLC